ncbi:MAG: hypothetical protein M3O20_17715, partial [Acidobacteriota bacterium]|nr:hypothetical protein [Acidobacteriota bacterium]
QQDDEQQETGHRALQSYQFTRTYLARPGAKSRARGATARQYILKKWANTGSGPSQRGLG